MKLKQDAPLRGSVLVVDDDLDAAEVIAESLRSRGFRATPEADPLAALEDALDDSLDVLVTDLQMESLDGLALCVRLTAARPDLPVVVITAHASIGAAVGALRAGAFDFITKPVDAELLAMTVARAVRHHRLASEVRRLRLEAADLRGASRLLGKSSAMRAVQEVIARIAPTQATVLVTGESGTGKELVARAIHERSSRREGPFVAINCAALPGNLLESELFGHVKGAFTDAQTDRRGLFLEAQGGTLFLDEIGDMPMEMQVKLLRALQERTVRQVGGNTEAPFDARVIAATNRDIEHDLVSKRFREDLFYRINVCSVDVPPLRERDGDLPTLAAAFVQLFAAKHDKRVKGITAEAMSKLLRYEWPGNVRELENGIERAVVMAQFDKLGVADLPVRIAMIPAASPHSMPTKVTELITASQLEHRYVHHVLKLVGGNKSRAARILGLDRRTLYRKVAANEAAAEAAADAAADAAANETDTVVAPS